MYEVKVALTGDTAEAETWEAALVAADTLCHDADDALPVQGRMRAARKSVTVTEDGSYRGTLTELARSGARSAPTSTACEINLHRVCDGSVTDEHQRPLGRCACPCHAPLESAAHDA